MAQIFINGNRSAGTINKNIYGQFAEHLGRCIYGGLANADGSPRADAVADRTLSDVYDRVGLLRRV